MHGVCNDNVLVVKDHLLAGRLGVIRGISIVFKFRTSEKPSLYDICSIGTSSATSKYAEAEISGTSALVDGSKEHR
jgi:hypothetical protein